MTDMSAIDYSKDGIDGTVVSVTPDFGGEGAAGAEPSAEPSAALPSGYVSDAELLAWLEAKSNGQNDALRAQMKISTERQDLIKDLNDLKSLIETAKTPEDVTQAKEKMQCLLHSEKYAPYAAELSELFDGTLALLEQPGTNVANVDAWLDVAALSGIKDLIASETDKLGKVDSLALVEIQQLMSDAKETSQLASNVLSSRDQTSSSIIGNIRG